MTFDIKAPTPLTDAAQNNELRLLCKKLERKLAAVGHEQLRCCNCGAARNDNNKLTTVVFNDELLPVSQGTFACPLCGHENHWRRVSRFITS